jgi:hypothetical protein
VAGYKKVLQPKPAGSIKAAIQKAFITSILSENLFPTSDFIAP